MPKQADKPFNSRQYQSRVEFELILGGIAITLVVGGGLIYLIWGVTALLTALACFGGIGLLIALLWGFLKLIEIISRD